MADIKDILSDIHSGSIDINNNTLFFGLVYKGLLHSLNNTLKIRGGYVPHMIMHTGDDEMYIEAKGYDYSIEPEKVSNENYIYNVIPRCSVEVGGIDVETDQLTSPAVLGNLEYESAEGNIYNLTGEFRRIPVKLDAELTYYVSSFRDELEIAQQLFTKLLFIRTYKIVYMGQVISCTYEMPLNVKGEHPTELNGEMTESRLHSISATLELRTQLPVWSEKTIMESTNTIQTGKTDIKYK